MITRDGLIQHWQSLASREKSTLVSGVVLLLCTGIYLALEPALLRRGQLAADIPRLRDDVTWMQSQLPELEQLHGANNSSTAGTPLSVALVEELLRQSGIYEQVTDLRPVQQSVTIRFDKVVYAQLVEFLSAVRARAAARISLASIRRNPDHAGHVEASLTLSPDAGP